MSRYTMTERRDPSNPQNDDPLAQAMKRFSGVYDIRDSQSVDVICASSNNLSALRKIQSRWNSMALTSV